MRTHTTQEFPQTRKAPAHNPIVISSEIPANVGAIIKDMDEADTTVVYITAGYSDFPYIFAEFQKQVGDKPYEVSMANKTIRMLNGSRLLFYRGDHALEQKLNGLQLTKIYIGSVLNLSHSSYNSLVRNLISRIR